MREAATAAPAKLSVASRDLLAAYIGQLGAIPLYRAEQELSQARQLEELETATWSLVLRHARGAAHGLQEAIAMAQNEEGSVSELPERLRAGLDQVIEQHARSGARSRGRAVLENESWLQMTTQLADLLRAFDRDKVLLDQVIGSLRQEAWGRQVMPSNASQRLSRADLAPIESARQQALQVRNAFVQANLRLVVSVARGFHHFRVPFIDLIQEGNMGLMKAVHRFDHRRGFRFSTYAHWWIRQSIERAIINKANQVRVPVHVVDARRQVQRAMAKLVQVLGRPPTAIEIGIEAQMSPRKVEQLLWGMQPEPISLDEKVGHDDSRTLVDMVADDNQAPQDMALMRESTNVQLHRLLAKLNDVERAIIARRFGLTTSGEMLAAPAEPSVGAPPKKSTPRSQRQEEETLDDIGKDYNLSRERVRQIQAQGLAKMRRMCERRDIN